MSKSAVLELNSDNQGLLLPRITDTALINALAPPDGMVIFFAPDKQILIRINGFWRSLSLTGNYLTALTGDVAAAGPGSATATVTGLRGASLPALSSGFLKYNGASWVFDNNTYLTGNQPITWMGSGDVSGSSTHPTFLSPTLTVNGLKGAALPALSAGFLKYNGTSWVFDNNAYLTGNQAITLSGDVTGSGTTAIASTISNGAVTYSKMQNVSATNRLLGRASTGAGVVEEIVVGTGLSFTGSTLNVNALPNSALANSTIGLALGTFGTDANVAGSPASLGGSFTLNLPSASATNRGLLTAADWTTFNSKGTGSVTSVGLSMPSIFTVSNSPVTTSGTLTTTLSSQAANQVFASPNGAAGTPAFRSMVKADLPSTIVYTDQANTYSAGMKQIFTPSATTAGLNLAGVAADPTAPANGDLWMNNTSSLLKTRLGGVVQEIVTNSATQTLTNKTLSGSSNTFTNIPNSALTNSTVGLALGTSGTDANVAGSPASLGGSFTLNLPSASATSRGLLTAADWNTFNSKGSGSVSSVSINSGNGFSGTVATSTTTPVITLSTTVSGLLKGNGTAISAATAGTDYVTPNAAILGSTKTKITYDSKGLVIAGADANTSDISEGANLYFTVPRARNSVSAGTGISYDPVTGIITNTITDNTQLTNGAGYITGNQSITWTGSGDVTGTASGTTSLLPSLTIGNGKVTYAKMQNVSANNRLLGRATTGAGVVEEITLGTGLSLSGTTLNVTSFSGTTNYLSKYTGTGTTLGISQVFDNGTNVGIGTATPAQKLDVSGNLSFSGALMPAGAAGTSGYILQSNGPGSAPTWIDPTGTGITNWAVNGNIFSGAADRRFGTKSANDLPFITNNSEGMRLTTAGNLGVGTAAPVATLDVAGTAKVGSSGTVLKNIAATDYSLPSAVVVPAGAVSGFVYTAGAVDITVPLSSTLNSTRGTVSVSFDSDLPTSVSVAWARVTSTSQVKIRVMNNSTTGQSIPSGTKVYITVIDF